MSDYTAALPWSEEAEQSVIGSAMLAPDAVQRLDDQALRPEHFFADAHRDIWAAMTELSVRRQPVDSITVSTLLRDRGTLDRVGGLSYLNDLCNSVISAANIRAYAKIVREKALHRQIIEAADNALAIAREPGEAADKLDRVASVFAAVQRPGSHSEPDSLSNVMLERVKHWTALENGLYVQARPAR